MASSTLTSAQPSWAPCCVFEGRVVSTGYLVIFQSGLVKDLEPLWEPGTISGDSPGKSQRAALLTPQAEDMAEAGVAQGSPTFQIQ